MLTARQVRHLARHPCSTIAPPLIAGLLLQYRVAQLEAMVAARRRQLQADHPQHYQAASSQSMQTRPEPIVLYASSESDTDNDNDSDTDEDLGPSNVDGWNAGAGSTIGRHETDGGEEQEDDEEDDTATHRTMTICD